MAPDGSMRSAVARCLTLAKHHAGQGEPERARGMVGLALDLAAPEELAAVVTAADGVLVEIGSRPRPKAAPRVEGATPEPEAAPAAVEEAPAPVEAPRPEPQRPRYAAPPAPPAPPARRRRSLFRAGPMMGVLTVSAVVWAVVTVVVSAPEGDADALLQRGRRALADGDTAAAVSSLRAAADAEGEGAREAAAMLRRLRR